MPPVTAAIVGCGEVAKDYVVALSADSHISLCAFCDQQLTRAREMAALAGSGAAFTSVHDLVAHGEFELVINLTSIQAHSEVSFACVTAGKHVYSEKPLASTVAEAEALIRAARRAGVQIGCAPDIVLGSPMRSAKAFIDAGALGVPREIEAISLSAGPIAWHPRPQQFYAAAAGPLFDMGPYYLTAMIHLIGVPNAVEGRAAAPHHSGSFTCVEAVLHFCPSIRASLLMSFESESEVERLVVKGDAGELVLPNLGRYDRPVFHPDPGEPPRPVPEIAGFRPERRGIGVLDMVRGIQTRATREMPASLALKVVQVLEAIDQSCRTGEAVRLPHAQCGA